MNPGTNVRKPVRPADVCRNMVAVCLRFGLAPALFWCVSATATSTPAAAPADDDVREVLLRQTQELLDALAPGKAEVWDKYLDPDVKYVDETGKVLTKKEMLADTKGLPAGVSGRIAATHYEVARHGDVAIATYVDDEYETYHGHELHCQYRTTQTWQKKPEGWRLIGAQVLAIRTDPPAVDLPANLRQEYCGKYALTPEITYEIRCKDGALEGQRDGRPAEALKAEASDVLFVPGRPRYRFVFLRDARGKITGFAERREAWDLVWKRSA
ncbi:MAG TPA: nuclear transport factor 2 family protein [Thermoanaerobaculia bacterium]|nr:nuclear transport factor 2 family protein [Thermoanaerobaculia bacterium]